MNVAFFIERPFELSKGGCENRMFTFAEELHKQNHKVIFFTTFSKKEKMKLDRRFQYFSVMKSQKTVYNKSGNRSILNILYYLFSIYYFIKFRKKYDILDLSQFPVLHLIFLPVLKIYGIKYVISYYEYWGFKLQYEYSKNYIIAIIGYFIELYIKFFNNNFIVISNKGYNFLKNKNTVLIDSPVNLKSNYIKFNDRKYDFIFFGRLKNHKNPNLSIKWFESFNKLYPSKKLLIIGDGPEKKNIHNQIINSNSKNNIKFIDKSISNKALWNYIANSKVFIFLSEKEGGGSITTCEALSLGLVVVCSNEDDHIDYRLCRFNNFMISEDLNDFKSYKLVNELMKNKKINNLSKTSSETHLNYYSPSSLTSKLIKFYESI
tara:strand:+ start:204 stop:1334 length:1131 start_codon:yes stop_codon:yes gene_type:complete